MASFTKNLCFLFLATIIVSSLQTNARESHFFSKVSRNRDNDDINLLKKNENEAKLFEEQLDLQEEQPSFIPQTSDNNGYGLYGHETGLDSPSTTTIAGVSTAATTTTTHATPTSLLGKDGQVDDKSNEIFENNKDEKNYVPELTGLSESSYTNNVAENKYDSNIGNKNDNNREIIGNDRVEEKNYVPRLTRTSETSYSNNVGPTEYVAENNYNHLNNHKYNDEIIGNDRKEKNYVPELTGLSEYVAENNYNKFNNKNSNNNRNNEIFGYNPESTRLSDTRYTNNIVPSNYVAENNYNNKNNNDNNNNHDEIFGNNPEFKGLKETYHSNNVVPSNYFPENNYNNDNINYKNERRYSTSAEYNNGGVEKQGMSDTRYLENGKYFYAINDEKKFYPTNNHMSYSNNYNNHHNFNNNNNNNNNNNKYNNNNYNGNEMQQEFEDQP